MSKYILYLEITIIEVIYMAKMLAPKFVKKKKKKSNINHMGLS